MAAASDKSKPYFPHNSGTHDGWTKEDEATATCFCGTVQLIFPTQGPGLVSTFVCNCSDCRKITASMFASNFTVQNSYLKHNRGQENLKTFSQAKTPASGNTMTNYFCSTCGTLMYRISSGCPDLSILRIGTIDDFNLQESKLRPLVEQCVKDRVSWFPGAEGAKQVDAMEPELFIVE